MHIFRPLLLLTALAALAGCTAWDASTKGISPPWGTTGTVVLLDGVSVINTKKTLDDHLVSIVLDKDCSTIRASHGEPYCEDYPKDVPTITRTTYCYRSLAAVTCYDQPLERDNARFYGSRVDDIPLKTP